MGQDGRCDDRRGVKAVEMKRAVIWVLAAAGAMAWAGGARGALPGSGSEEEPYLIGDYAARVEFSQVVNGGKPSAWGRLTNDIVATGTDWTPIGTDGYYGTFDGDGHTIRGLSNEGVAEAPGRAGLFVCLLGTVRNVRLKEVSFKGTMSAGGIAGDRKSVV